MNVGTTLAFDLPQGWTLRKVATSLVRVWLPPFRSERVGKTPPWSVQPVLEDSAGTAPLWEPGISTEAYEERLDRDGVCWAIRARAGKGHGTILARLAMSEGQPTTFELVCTRDSFPETLFDAEKLANFLDTQGADGAEGLFAGLLAENGFKLASS